MSSEKSGESTSFSGSGQAWAKPYAKQGVNAVLNSYRNAQPTLDSAIAGTSGLATQLSDKFGRSQSGAQGAQDYWQKVLGGGFLNSNPHLDSVINAASGDIRDSVNSQYAGAGRYGSAYHDKAVASEIGQMASGLRYNDYNNQLGRMDQAAMGAAGANNADAAQALGAYGQQANIPYIGSTALANSLAALFNGGNSKSVQYSPNPIWGAVGAGLGAAGAYFGSTPSERRLKKNIVKVGELADGLPVYDFVYKNDPSNSVQRGVMVDEVEKLRPWALGPKINGIQTVNYAHIEPLAA